MIEKLKSVLSALDKSKYAEPTWAEIDQSITDLRSVIAEMEAGEPVEIRYRKHYPSGPHDGNRRVGDWMRMPYGARGLKDCATSLAAADCVEYLYTHPQPKTEQEVAK